MQVQRQLLEGSFGVNAMRICLVLQIIIPADNVLVAAQLRGREGDLHSLDALHAIVKSAGRQKVGLHGVLAESSAHQMASEYLPGLDAGRQIRPDLQV